MSENIDTDEESVILADTVSRQKNTARKGSTGLQKKSTKPSSKRKIAKYEACSSLKKPSSGAFNPNNTLEDRTDADNRLKEFLQGIRSTVLNGKEHWYDSTANRPYTLQEIANIMGVSRERVRQVEEAGLRKMWRYLSAMSKRENLNHSDWLKIADSKHGEESTIYMP